MYKGKHLNPANTKWNSRNCVSLYFVLLSELEHFGLLSQYYRPLGSWSALLVSSFLLVTTRLARQRGVTFSLDRCVLFFLQLSLSFFLFLLSFLFFSFFLLLDIVKALLNGWLWPCGWYLAAAKATSLLQNGKVRTLCKEVQPFQFQFQFIFFL